MVCSIPKVSRKYSLKNTSVNSLLTSKYCNSKKIYLLHLPNQANSNSHQSLKDFQLKSLNLSRPGQHSLNLPGFLIQFKMTDNKSSDSSK